MKTLIVLLLVTSGVGAMPTSISTQSDSALLFNQAIKYYNSADYRKAQSLFEEPNHERQDRLIDYYLGVCSFQTGDYRKALEYLSASSVEDSLFSLARYHQAKTMIALRNPTAAIEYLRESMSRDSTYEPVRLEMVKTLCNLGRYKEAEEFVGDRFDELEVIALCNGLLDVLKYEYAYPFISKIRSKSGSEGCRG